MKPSSSPIRHSPFVIRNFLLSLLLAACSQQAPAPEAARPAKLYTIPPLTAEGFRNYPASIGANKNVELSFEVSGTLAQFPVDAGQIVPAGHVLARLDPRDFQATLDAAIASFTAATAEFTRQKSLYENQATSLAKLQNAQRDLDVARSERDKAQKALQDTVLKAPFAGRVARKGPDEFTTVKAGDFIVQLQDISSLEAAVDISENDIVLAVRGATVDQINQRLQSENRVPQVEFPNLPGVRLPLLLKNFETTADPATRTFRITFGFDPAGHNVLPGMTANVLAKPAAGQAGPNMLLIPSSAVIEDPEQGRIVWKVDPATQAVSPVPVQAGTVAGDQIEITGGLAPGDTIVTTGGRTLRTGMKVKPLQEPAP
jgi:RND family efflux transporter MFP subunit